MADLRQAVSGPGASELSIDDEVVLKTKAGTELAKYRIEKLSKNPDDSVKVTAEQIIDIGEE